MLSPIPQEEDKLNNKSLSSLGQRGGWIINESGLYALIFGSKLESAKRFKRWVTSGVLPVIRKIHCAKLHSIKNKNRR
ncbi:MAG: Bro-N domain-containing protein [Coprococcus sp.]